MVELTFQGEIHIEEFLTKVIIRNTGCNQVKNFIMFYKITRVQRTLLLDKPHFLSEYRDMIDVIFILY